MECVYINVKKRDIEVLDALDEVSLMFCLFVFIVSAKVQSPRAFPSCGV